MNIVSIKLAASAFAQTGQYGEALRAGKLMPGSELKDRLFVDLVGYYLQQAKALKPHPFDCRDSLAWNKTVEYLETASLTAAAIDDCKIRTATKKSIIRLSLGYLKEQEAPLDKLVEVINTIAKRICISDFAFALGTDSLAHEVINAYLKVPGVKGRSIFEISQCLGSFANNGEAPYYTEAKRLMEIFIKRGDFDALKAVGDKHGKLKDELMNRAEEIIQACLKNNNINGAIGALSWIIDTGKRWEYAELLGSDLKDQIKKN